MSTSAIALSRRGVRFRGRAADAALALLIAAIAAGLTWFTTHVGELKGMIAVFAVTSLVWLATTRRTLLALAVFMIYIGAFDGYLKLSSGSQVVTLVRDALLYAIAAGLLVRAQVQRTRLTLPPLSWWVLGFVVLVLVQLVNPRNGTFLHSLGGVRQHLEFVPLFFITFAFVRTTKALRSTVILLLVIASANGVVSFYQFKLTPQQMAAWGPGYAERVLGQGRFVASARTFAAEGKQTQVRPFGLGSDAGAGGVIGGFALGGVAALAARFGRLRYQLFAVAMAIGAIVAIVTSQGRGAVLCAVAIALTYALLLATSRRGMGAFLGLAIAAAVSVFAIQAVVGSLGTSALRYQGLTASKIVETTNKAREGTPAAIQEAITKYPFGGGLGIGGPAGDLPGAGELDGQVNAESEFAFMTYEAGVPGMLLLTAFPIMLLALGFLRLRDEPDAEARTLLAALLAPVAGTLLLYYPGIPTVTTPTGPYLWAIGGIVAYWLVARPAARRREQAAIP